jgi:hypothetical protein
MTSWTGLAASVTEIGRKKARYKERKETEGKRGRREPRRMEE